MTINKNYIDQPAHFIVALVLVILSKVVPPTYSELRAAAYPPIVDQLDTIFHGGLDAWKAEIQVTKNKYPKEAS